MVLLERFEAPQKHPKKPGKQGFSRRVIGVVCTNFVCHLPGLILRFCQQLLDASTEAVGPVSRRWRRYADAPAAASGTDEACANSRRPAKGGAMLTAPICSPPED